MRKVVGIAGAIVLLLLVAAGGGLVYLLVAFPKAGPPANLHVEITPERVARGKYLANHVTVCIDCHSTRDWRYFSGPIVPGTEGKGGERFGKEEGFPGTFYSKNITPANLKTWTDGEIARAITSGVEKDGRAFFPVMPYPSYNRMAKEDLYSIIAYLRTLKPIENQTKEAKLDFPMNLIVRTIPQPYHPQTRPAPSDTVAYGRYLLGIAGCADCHTPRVQGKPMAGMTLAGGFEFRLQNGDVVRSANLTPDEETGIGGWSRENFIGRFKAFSGPESRKIAVKEGEGNTVMPWTMYAGMTDQDLGAIYAYLRTVKPVSHRVEWYPNKKAPAVEGGGNAD